MGNLIDIQNQIEKLQKQAAEIRSKEFRSTVQDIRDKMQAFGITLKDLQTGKGHAGKAKAGVASKRAGAAAKKKTASAVAPKYRGPAGQTWSGRGLMPRWLAVLVSEGKTKEEFAIKN